MRKSIKYLAWLAAPIVLAVGCAENRRDPSVSYSPALSESVAPTSDRATERVYPETSANTSANIEATAPPPGAGPEDWKLAEEIRSLLTANPKLGNAPMAATVNHGVVTLRGSVRNKKDREQLREEIARLPGVQRVDDQMDFKNPLGVGSGESKTY
jgi:osmotically-inducible protein OsmY